MDQGEQYLFKTSWLTLAFIYCTCLLAFSLSYCIHLARDKNSCAYVSSNKLSMQKSHTQAVPGATDWGQGLTLPVHSQNHNPQGWSAALLAILYPFAVCSSSGWRHRTASQVMADGWRMLQGTLPLGLCLSPACFYTAMSKSLSCSVRDSSRFPYIPSLSR